MRARQSIARLFGGLCALAIMGASAISPAAAQAYPDHSVRLVLAFGAGGTIDALARILGDKLGERWNQGVIVDNRPGGSGNIGAAGSAHAPPDGYTLHLGAQSLATNVTLVPAANFDPVRDFEPVVFIGYAQDVLMVSKDSPIHSVADLVAAAKAKPGALNFASTGIGSSGHLATIQFEQLTGISAEHVPYTSLGAAVTDLLSGRISFWMATLGGHLGNLKSGAVRALGATKVAAAIADLMHGAPAWSLLVLGLAIIAGTVFERWRYRTVEHAAPPGFEPNGERFRDPVSNIPVTVYVHPKTGARRYVRGA
jgi:tripartite-type tricarboxylate transporter receptor subunit TctC